MEDLKRRTKVLHFLSNYQENKDQSNKDTKEDMLEAITYIGIKFNNLLRRLDKYWRTNVQDIKSGISYQRKSLEEDKGN